jgi:acyl carrier protein
MKDILAKVQEAFQMAFDIDPQMVNIDTGPDQIPGWDSLGHVALASSLERIFAVALDVDDLMAMEDVRAIIKVIQGKLGYG